MEILGGQYGIARALTVLSISIFEKIPVYQLFTDSQFQYFKEQNDNQLKLFEL
jgi:hypothetical protein